MVCTKVTDLEDDVLEGADGGLCVEFWWVCDNTGESFEDGCSGGDDVGAGICLIPVSSILDCVSFENWYEME